MINKDNQSIVNINIPAFNAEGGTVSLFKFPQIGISKSTNSIFYCDDEILQLRKVNFDHLLADIKLYIKNWAISLIAAIKESNALGWPLKLSVYVDNNSLKELAVLTKLLKETIVDIKFITICFHNTGLLSDAGKNFATKVLEILQTFVTGCEVKTSMLEKSSPEFLTNFFKFVQYTFSLRLSGYSYLNFTPKINHQVNTISQIKEFNKNIHIRINQAFVNSYNITKANIFSDEKYTLAEHEKQNLIFSAGWVIKYLQHFLPLEVCHFTFYEICGDRGIIQPTNNNGQAQEKTYAFLPLYHVIQAIMQFKEGAIYPFSDPVSEVPGIMLVNGNEKRILISNLRQTTSVIQLKGVSKYISVRKMNINTLENTIYCPLWIIGEPEFVETNNIDHTEIIFPYSILLVDLLEDI